MPTLENFNTRNPVKGLIIGDSGTGKTGALASLAIAGYKLRILDYDKGVHPIVEAIQKAGKPEALKNVIYQTMDDKYTVVAGRVSPRGVPEAFSRGLAMLDYWGPRSLPGSEDLGKPSEWGLDTVLVIDSLTHMCNAALRLAQCLNKNSGELKITQPEWGMAQNMVEQMLSLLYSGEFKTNVLVLAHISYIQGKEKLDAEGNPAGEIRGLPSALGTALPPKIPAYFNIMLQMIRSGTGAHAKRYLTTVPSGVINTKSPILTGIPAQLPIETGLATYFNVALGKDLGGKV